MFYDADILEEKVLLEWAGKVSKKYVSRDLSQEIHTKAEPFIKWLKEAEEEDDTDSEGKEDDEDDLEVCYVKSVYGKQWMEHCLVTFKKINTWFLQHSLWVEPFFITQCSHLFNDSYRSFILFCQIEYDDRAKASPLKEQPKQIANKKRVNDDNDDDDEDGEDDLDIDAI